MAAAFIFSSGVMGSMSIGRSTYGYVRESVRDGALAMASRDWIGTAPDSTELGRCLSSPSQMYAGSLWCGCDHERRPTPGRVEQHNLYEMQRHRLMLWLH